MTKKKKRKRRRRGSVIMVPVASMGDIAFLLIIFFVLCSNFLKENLEVEPAVSPDIGKLEQKSLSVTIDKYGDIYLQGTKVRGAQDIEAGLAALLKGRTNEQEKIVLFKCDKNIDREIYEPVVAAIARAGGLIGAIGEKVREGTSGR